MQAAFIPKNLELELKTKRGKALIDSVIKDDKLSDEEKLKLCPHQATVGMFESRSANSALTGEWLIYAKHKGQRYYLSIAPHSQHPKDDTVIYNRMMDRCEIFFQKIIQAEQWS